MSQPLDRTCQHSEIGPVDREAGEFWTSNPFMMPQLGENLSAYERNCVFLNVDGTGFIDASFASPANIDSDSRSVMSNDFDGDGNPDVLVGSVGGGPLRLFLNHMNSANRLRLKLRGTTSNRSAIGTRVTAHVGETRIVRDLFPQNGCLGVAAPYLDLATGSADVIDKLEIRWPDGRSQLFSQVNIEGVMTLDQGQELQSSLAD